MFCFLVVKSRPYSFIIYHQIVNTSNTSSATKGARIAYPSGEHEFGPVVSWVPVVKPLIFCVVFLYYCLSFRSASFGDCVVRPSIYVF
jgi:hypothetical protein